VSVSFTPSAESRWVAVSYSLPDLIKLPIPEMRWPVLVPHPRQPNPRQAPPKLHQFPQKVVVHQNPGMKPHMVFLDGLRQNPQECPSIFVILSGEPAPVKCNM